MLRPYASIAHNKAVHASPSFHICKKFTATLLVTLKQQPMQRLCFAHFLEIAQIQSRLGISLGLHRIALSFRTDFGRGSPSANEQPN